MKIFLITQFLSNLGGCERFVVNLAVLLHQCGHDVQLAIAEPNVLPHWREELNIVNFRLLTEGTAEEQANEVYRFVTAFQPDVVHAIPYESVAFALVRKYPELPLVATEPSNGSESCGWWYSGETLRSVINMFPFIHVFSETAKRNLISEYNYGGGLCRLFPPARLDFHAPYWSRRIPANKVMFMGRLSGEKGLEFLINCFNRQPDLSIELHLYGDGPLRNKIEAKSKKQKNRVIFHGRYEPHEIDYGEYDVLVIPSLFEGLPYVFLEALHAGIPVIFSRVGGMWDSVRGTSIDNSFDREDEAGLRACITSLYQTFGQQAELAPIRRKLVRGLTHADDPAKPYLECYKSALDAMI